MSSDGLLRLRQIREKYGVNNEDTNNQHQKNFDKIYHQKIDEREIKRSQSTHINKNIDKKSINFIYDGYNSRYNDFSTHFKSINHSPVNYQKLSDNENLRSSCYSSSILKNKQYNLQKYFDERQLNNDRGINDVKNNNFLKNNHKIMTNKMDKLMGQNNYAVGLGQYDYVKSSCQEGRKSLMNSNQNRLSLYDTATPNNLAQGTSWTLDNLNRVQNKIQAYLRR